MLPRSLLRLPFAVRHLPPRRPRTSSTSLRVVMAARVLALHGHTTNAAFLHSQLHRSNFAESFASVAELHPVDGPLLTEPREHTPKSVAPPFRAWWDAQRRDDASWSYHGWSETFTYLENYVREEGPFVGLLGFSQGAAVAAAMVGLQQAGQRFTESPPFQFAVLISGFPARDAELSAAFASPIQCPSVHIMGKRDLLTSASRRLAEQFVNPLVVEHSAGHVVPTLEPPEKEQILHFLSSAANVARL